MEKTHWIPAYIECSICTYRWTAIFDSRLEELICPHCDNHTTIEIVRDPVTGDSLSIKSK